MKLNKIHKASTGRQEVMNRTVTAKETDGKERSCSVFWTFMDAIQNGYGWK